MIKTARKLLQSVFTDGDLASFSQFNEDPFGLHGPGSVFDGSSGKDKWSFENIPGLPCSLWQGQYSSLLHEELEVERRSRLCVVPKDYRGHRLICIEPKEMMFYEQGLLRTVEQIVRDHLITSMCIDFRDQSKSYRLSRSQRFATIDLSDASDNLRKDLCRYLFPKEIYSVLAGARCNEVELPNGDVVIPTTMYTMGNALCFPIETLVFWALTLSTMLHQSGSSWRAERVKPLVSFIREHPIRIFGDDIIVPREYFDEVCNTLACCGLKVSDTKSCNRTPIREACGSWYAFGIDCSNVKLHVDAVESFTEWISVRETVRLLFQSGFTSAAKSIKSILDAYYSIPIGCLGSRDCSTENRRYNVQLQRLEWRFPSLTAGRPDVLDGEIGLYSYFTGRGSHTVSRSDAECVEWEWRSEV